MIGPYMTNILHNIKSLTSRHAFEALQSHCSTTAPKNTPAHRVLSMTGLYMSIADAGQDETVCRHLNDLARECGVEEMRDAMFEGTKINNTEDRAVLHTALRRPASDKVLVDGENVMPFIHDVLDRMKSFSDKIRADKKFTSIVNIGIGGSDLGPAMVCDALKAFQSNDLEIYFVSNVDGAHLASVLRKCDPETTLFLIASKTFTTQETMRNAYSARTWMINALGEDAVQDHFAALSTNEKAVQEFGIDPENMFPFKDWVGGRYSLWSAIGLPIAIAVGFENFEQLLRGAYDMDRHFQTTALEDNIPVQLALHGIFNRNVRECSSVAVIPYAQDLARFPAYLQQLDMESNGKSVRRDGSPIADYKTGPVVFGEPGTSAQHSFFQLLHQGTDIIPVEFIGFKKARHDLDGHHEILINNMLAQREALCNGKVDEDRFKHFDGARPCVTLLLDELDPYHLGMLIALYEHKVFVQGVIWGINSFDQFGVELGKQIAKAIADDTQSKDPVTEDLIAALK